MKEDRDQNEGAELSWLTAVAATLLVVVIAILAATA